jgi:hypothetical protein
MRSAPALSLLALLASLLAGAMPAAASDIRAERVHFARGASSATIEGRIHGDQGIDYVLGAREGQQMRVSMASRHAGASFNIIAPGETDVAMFIGEQQDNRFEGVLPKSGDYRVRVFLVRAAARRGETADFRLEIAIAGAAPGQAAPAPQAGVGATASAAERAGMGTFNVTGNIPCAQNRGQPMNQCPFGVARGPAGEAVVAITLFDGRKRLIFFEKGRAVGANTSQADGDKPFHATWDSGLSMIRVGDERYEIPDAVPLGG